ncbi:MAG: hypothetical protein ABS49_02710 [Erythrobacter sp. SCN 62-14]|nr:MAG: hypothetical protein ABS49_02710 [Erythrobacter sp. SCN 62-14]
MDERLPAHLEAASILRLAESLGGFATVLAKGERDAGTILIAILCRGGAAQLYERMPALDGSRRFVATKAQNPDDPTEFTDYLERRRRRDPDIWILEVDIDEAERFTAILP